MEIVNLSYILHLLTTVRQLYIRKMGIQLMSFLHKQVIFIISTFLVWALAQLAEEFHILELIPSSPLIHYKQTYKTFRALGVLKEIGTL